MKDFMSHQKMCFFIKNFKKSLRMNTEQDFIFQNSFVFIFIL